MILSVFSLSILALITYLAFDDYKTKHVDNKVNAILWLVVGFAFSTCTDLGSLRLMAFSFGFLWLANEVVYSKTKKQIVAWGDLLVVPPILAFTESQGVTQSFALFTVFAMIIFSYYYYVKLGKKSLNVKTPLIAFLWLPLIFALICSLV